MMNNHNGYKLSLSSKTSSLSGTIWWGGCLQSVFYLYLYISVFVFVCLYIYIYLNLSLCDPLLSRPPCPGGLSWLCLLTQGLLTAQGKQRFLSHHTGESPALQGWVGNIHFFLMSRTYNLFWMEISESGKIGRDVFFQSVSTCVFLSNRVFCPKITSGLMCSLSFEEQFFEAGIWLMMIFKKFKWIWIEISRTENRLLIWSFHLQILAVERVNND